MAQLMDALVKPVAGPGLELRQPWAQEHIKPPMVIGHEYVGEVAQLGAGVTGLYVGQRVSGEGHITCGRCRNCHTGNIQWCKDTQGVGVDRDGAFAESTLASAPAFAFVIDGITDLTAMLTELAEKTGVGGDLIVYLMKIAGAGYIIEFACGAAEEAKMPSLSGSLSLAGKIVILCMTIPVLAELTDVVIGLLSGS